MKAPIFGCIFAASIFLSAFLLFQIQPIIGKVILPWFGGTPAVWTTVMLFFQVLLTSGYAYAYWLAGSVTIARQGTLHGLLILSAAALLIGLGFFWGSPVMPPAGMKPKDVSFPIGDIFVLLSVTVALPYFVLAANGPLMQAWFSRAFPERAYARLYALSNAGSLLGLLTYPTLVEPHQSLKSQGWSWTIGFLLFSLLAVFIAFRQEGAGRQLKLASEAKVPEADDCPPAAATKSLWIALSGTASLLLLSTTSQISQEVAVIPFLWILPLTLYLLSFILTFSGEGGYNRKLYLGLFATSVVALIYVLFNVERLHLFAQIFSYCLFLFSGCMLCHGELHLLRPGSRHLTAYYLMISLGSALGGIFASLVAPLIFNGYWEFTVALALAMAVWLRVLRPSRMENHKEWASFMLTVFLLFTATTNLVDRFSGVLFAERNFFGVIRVKEVFPLSSSEPAYAMTHGITVHGVQFIDPVLRNLPTTYYMPEGGGGLVLLNHPRRGKGMKVGLFGLGIGTLAAYGQADDEYRLYEINPSVAALAEGKGDFFHYLKNSKAKLTTILGDARISLERELAGGNPQHFDVLVLDTFSSDSIPVHLLTKEAFELYLKHLAPQGMMAIHISNLHLDLRPVVWQLAKFCGLQVAAVNYPGDKKGGYPTDWLLLARDPALLDIPAIGDRADRMEGYGTTVKLWTDDYSNLFQILK
jgi:hypothetical protein